MFKYEYSVAERDTFIPLWPELYVLLTFVIQLKIRSYGLQTHRYGAQKETFSIISSKRNNLTKHWLWGRPCIKGLIRKYNFKRYVETYYTKGYRINNVCGLRSPNPTWPERTNSFSIVKISISFQERDHQKNFDECHDYKSVDDKIFSFFPFTPSSVVRRLSPPPLTNNLGYVPKSKKKWIPVV